MSKLKQFIDKKKKQTIINIENSSALVFILKWLATHKLSIILLIMLAVLGGRYYMLERELMIERNKTLEAEKIEILKESEDLKAQILKEKKNLVDSRVLTEATRRRARSMSAEDKKRTILEQIKKLKAKRGLK